jgi:hypothetical protein
MGHPKGLVITDQSRAPAIREIPAQIPCLLVVVGDVLPHAALGHLLAVPRG